MNFVKPAAITALALLATACGKKEEPVMPSAGNAPPSA